MTGGSGDAPFLLGNNVSKLLYVPALTVTKESSLPRCSRGMQTFLLVFFLYCASSLLLSISLSFAPGTNNLRGVRTQWRSPFFAHFIEIRAWRSNDEKSEKRNEHREVSQAIKRACILRNGPWQLKDETPCGDFRELPPPVKRCQGAPYTIYTYANLPQRPASVAKP